MYVRITKLPTASHSFQCGTTFVSAEIHKRVNCQPHPKGEEGERNLDVDKGGQMREQQRGHNVNFTGSIANIILVTVLELGLGIH